MNWTTLGIDMAKQVFQLHDDEAEEEAPYDLKTWPMA
jgi:hypothetical protein